MKKEVGIPPRGDFCWFTGLMIEQNARIFTYQYFPQILLGQSDLLGFFVGQGSQVFSRYLFVLVIKKLVAIFY